MASSKSSRFGANTPSNSFGTSLSSRYFLESAGSAPVIGSKILPPIESFSGRNKIRENLSLTNGNINGQLKRARSFSSTAVARVQPKAGGTQMNYDYKVVNEHDLQFFRDVVGENNVINEKYPREGLC